MIFDFGRTLYSKESNDFFPEVKEVLTYLYPKYKLAIVSIATENLPAEERSRLLEEAGLSKYFSSVMFHDSEKDQLFIETLQKLGISASEAAFVDDRVQRGIAWGNKHGGLTIWFRNGKYADEMPDQNTGKPDYTIGSLLQIKKIL